MQIVANSRRQPGHDQVDRCLGTARNTESKVWYTVAGGLLSDVYYPTIDNTNVETLQYVVTGGETFTDLQARDMTYTVEAVTDTGGMACKVTASDKEGLYSIATTYVTDPSRNVVLMRVAFRSHVSTGSRVGSSISRKRSQ